MCIHNQSSAVVLYCVLCCIVPAPLPLPVTVAVQILFYAGLFELQSMAKVAPFFREEGMKSRKDSRCTEIEGREGLQ